MPLPLLVGLLGAIGSAATAAGGAAAAAGAAAAGAAAAAGTAAVGAAAAAGTTAVAAAGTAATALTAAAAAHPVVAGTAILVGGVAIGAESEKENQAEKQVAARNEGFKDGYTKGCIDTKRKFAETTEEHVAKVCGMYGLGMLIMQWHDCDKIGWQTMIEVLGEPCLQEEYVRAELNNLLYSAEMDTWEFGDMVFGKYLSKVGADGIKDCDRAVKAFANVCARKGYDVSDFYDEIWEPYFCAKV